MTAAHFRTTLLLAALVAACGPAPQPAVEAGDEQVEGEGAPRTPRVVLGDSAVRLAGILVGTARAAASSPDAFGLTVPGEVAADPSRIALITPRAEGRLERLHAAVGEQVRAGAVVAEVLSPDLLLAESDYQLAYRRAQRLIATPDSAGAWALVEGAGRRLALLGVGSGELDRLASGGEPTALAPLITPFRGSLVEGGALPGSHVEPGTVVFRLVDLSEVDVLARVPETEIPTLRVGQRARVILDAFPDRVVTGVVERVRDELDPTTRTIEAVLHVANPGGWMRPGMFGSVLLQGSGARPTDVLVPQSAVVTEGDGQAVFVEIAPNSFERRSVMVVALPPIRGEAAPQVLIRSGLKAGDRIVVQGAFTLKSELGKAGFAEEE